jgi:hypothetical protein
VVALQVFRTVFFALHQNALSFAELSLSSVHDALGQPYLTADLFPAQFFDRTRKLMRVIARALSTQKLEEFRATVQQFMTD